MEGLNRDNCAWAKDGSCKFPRKNCETCKLTPSDSEFHAKLCIGALTYEDVERMCKGKIRELHKASRHGKSPCRERQQTTR